ncbi:MAG: hypothetical protein CBC12_00825 [Candidatus Puniceispirillum sp. TMED52]|nr:MAG: hypothetical protein CBC12_00825 [Candidatus Puniceispirillum sp. TMED52]
MARLIIEEALTKSELCIRQGKEVEARQILLLILQHYPKNEEAHSRLLSLDSQKKVELRSDLQAKFTEAASLYERDLFEEFLVASHELRIQFPKTPLLWKLVGEAALKTKNFESAEQAYRKLVELEPGQAENYNNLGSVLIDLQKTDEALKYLRKALSINPAFFEAASNLGNALSIVGETTEALEICKNALRMEPTELDRLNILGNLFITLNSPNEALKAFKKVVSADPNNAFAHHGLGLAYKDGGNTQEAIRSLERSISLNPNNCSNSHYALSSMKKYSSDDPQIGQMIRMLEFPEADQRKRHLIYFSLGRVFRQLGEWEKSFNFFLKGNKLRKDELRYDSEQDIILFNRLKAQSPKIRKFALNPKPNEITQLPIFVIGMPRSGTTLVEQILSSHSLVFGAGELNLVARLAENLSVGDVVPSQKKLQAFRNEYLEKIAGLGDGVQFVVDKMPQNFLHVCSILSAMPEAKIIYVKRDAAATCWSNFTLNFPGGLGYSYDLQDVVLYYRLHLDLMSFWRKLFPKQIYLVDYELLTAHPEKHIKKLISYLELDWQDACLTPETNNRVVRTASQRQVKRKIYTGSSRSWKAYARFLNGIFDDLE